MPIQNERQDAICWLIDYFPNAFFAKAKDVKPLKLGIFEDLLDFYERLSNPPISKKSLRDALNYYSSSRGYLRAQVEGAPRIDLFGFEMEHVTREQAAYAKAQLTKRTSASSTLR